MKNKTKIIVIIIAIILVGATFFIGYFHYVSKQKEMETNNTISHKRYEDNEYWQSVENIIYDEYLREISNNITILNQTKSKNIKKYIIPIQIDGKEIKSFTPDEFYEEYGKIFDGKDIPVIKNDDISIKYSEKIRIKNIKNTKKEALDYKSNKRNINIKSLGTGIYIIELEVNKNDVFYMLFK